MISSVTNVSPNLRTTNLVGLGLKSGYPGVLIPCCLPLSRELCSNNFSSLNFYFLLSQVEGARDKEEGQEDSGHPKTLID